MTAEWCHPGGVILDHEPQVVYSDDAGGLSPITKCDFCSGGSLEWWRYPCSPFSVEGSQYGSADDWAACWDCHRLIEMDRWRSVANRMVEFKFPNGSGSPVMRRLTRESIMELHHEFRKHRTGPAVKL